MITPKFTSIDYTQKVEVEGIEFEMDCSSKTGDFMKANVAQLQNIAAGLPDDLVEEDAVVNFGAEVIDHVLGEGATDKIFGGGERDMTKVIDIVTYLLFVAVEFNKDRIVRLQEMAKGGE